MKNKEIKKIWLFLEDINAYVEDLKKILKCVVDNNQKQLISIYGTKAVTDEKFESEVIKWKQTFM